MNAAKTPAAGEHPHAGDVLAEVGAEIAQEIDDERPAAGGPTYQVVAALIGLVIGIAGTAMSFGYGLGTFSKPGPGQWPFIVSVVITVLSAILLAVGRGLTDAEKFTRSSWLPVIGAVTFIAFALLLPYTGFEIPALVLCVIWLRFLGGETWRSTIITSVVTVTAFYALFLYGLHIPLPHLIAI